MILAEHDAGFVVAAAVEELSQLVQNVRTTSADLVAAGVLIEGEGSLQDWDGVAEVAPPPQKSAMGWKKALGKRWNWTGHRRLKSIRFLQDWTQVHSSSWSFVGRGWLVQWFVSFGGLLLYGALCYNASMCCYLVQT